MSAPSRRSRHLRRRVFGGGGCFGRVVRAGIVCDHGMMRTAGSDLHRAIAPAGKEMRRGTKANAKQCTGDDGGAPGRLVGQHEDVRLRLQPGWLSTLILEQLRGPCSPPGSRSTPDHPMRHRLGPGIHWSVRPPPPSPPGPSCRQVSAWNLLGSLEGGSTARVGARALVEPLEPGRPEHSAVDHLAVLGLHTSAQQPTAARSGHYRHTCWRGLSIDALSASQC